MGTLKGKYVSLVSYFAVPAPITNPVVTIEALFRSSKVAKPIQSKTIIYATTNMGRTWICSPGGANAVEAKYLPSACRP